MEKLKSALSKDHGVEIESKNVNDIESAEEDVLMASKSQEFDPVSSRLEKVILDDDYAAVTVEDDSPYAEVRASVPSSDDADLPQNTIRMWVLGMILNTIGSALNLLFSLHSPQIILTTLVTSLLAWPIGMAWARFMPNIKIFGAPLNPGPFNIKEHTIIVIMANVSFGGGAAYATDILLSQNKFYEQDFGWGFDLLAIWSTQCIGFALGGLARRVLVNPASMIWPQNLVTVTFLTNLHVNSNHVADGWKISRLYFFALIGICSFLWYWFPNYIFQALSWFAFPTWIAPKNVIVNQVFGAYTGLGLIPITFDWNQISGYIGSPLIPPASAIATILLSMVTIFWIIVPAIHYSNTWYAQYLPISSSGSYDRYGSNYNVSRIINKDTLSFNEKNYQNYSPLFLSTTFAISYGLSFAAMFATLVHTVLFHGKDIMRQLKQKEKPDVHMRLMRQNYKDVPEWWFLIVFLVFFGLSIVTVRCWNTEMPVYALIVALLIAVLFLLPVGIIFALTNIAVGLNVVTEFIIGYMVPGKPLAMMFFKTYGYITNNQAITFVQDMKLGHYMKVAPRLLFAAQFIASIWGSLVQVAVLRWSYGNIPNLCEPDQANNYTCPNGKVFFNASIIWGVIGPERQFSQGQIYYGLLFFFIIGALLPLMNWLILKKWPNSPIRWLNWPVFFSGTGYIPPATPYNYSAYCAVGLAFGYWIKRRWFHWWSKYNYSLSAGLDIGMAWSSVIIFLTISLTKTSAPNWWGNNVIETTMDMTSTAIRQPLAEGEWFGPSSW